MSGKFRISKWEKFYNYCFPLSMGLSRNVIRLLILLVAAALAFGGTGCKEKKLTTVVDPNEDLCFKQCWRDGTWEALPAEPNTRTYIFAQPDPSLSPNPVDGNDVFYLSLCEEDFSIRVVDPNSRRHRIILSPEAKINGLGKTWMPAVSFGSMDPLYCGDMIAVLYGGHLSLIRIDEIEDTFEEENTVKISNAENLNVHLKDLKVDLNQLTWKSCIAKNALEIGKRKINIRTVLLENSNTQKLSQICMFFQYDNYYGYYGGAARYKKPLMPAYIAIIHKPQIKSDLLDLKRFRFKSWEDGLGNLCDPNTCL